MSSGGLTATSCGNRYRPDAMYWQEENKQEQFTVPENVVDLLFSVKCPTLPVDHAWILSRAIAGELDWFEHEANCGLHLIHGAESGNGWERPQGADDILYLPKRTKLILRLPANRIEDAMSLSGKTLMVGNHTMQVGDGKTRPLAMTNFLYARYVVGNHEWNEDQFMQWAVGELRKMRLRFKKVLCGKSAELATPDGATVTHSLMVADLPYEDAVYLQEEGLGPMRSMGCGLFVPQKSF